MKRNFTKLFVLAAAMLVGVNASAQKGWSGAFESYRVIDENFQNWEKSHTVADQATIEAGYAAALSSKWIDANVEIPVYEGAGNPTGVKFYLQLVACAVAPDFYTQYYGNTSMTEYPKDLVSKGFIELGRKTGGYAPVAPQDGELIIPAMEFIEGVEYSFSSTGGKNRGFALYQSVDGGEWELVREETGNMATSTSQTSMAESGYGQRFEDLINGSNVSLKFTLSPRNTQVVRIHDLRVYGIVGDHRSIDNTLADSFKILSSKSVVKISENADVELISVSGQVVKAAKNVSELNIQDLPSGVYVVKATAVGSGEVRAKKIVK